MKISLEQKKMIIEEHKKDKTPLSYLARKYGMNRSALDYTYQFYLKRGDEAFVKKYSQYSVEEKTEAVKRVLNGESPKSVAIELKLSGQCVLSNWKFNYLKNSNKIINMKKEKNDSINTALTSDEKDKLALLQKENLRLKAEIDYLKKLRALREMESQKLTKK